MLKPSQADPSLLCTICTSGVLLAKLWRYRNCRGLFLSKVNARFTAFHAKKICSICSYARLIMMSRILLCRASACSQILSLRAGLAAGITRISVISNFGNDYWSGSLLWNTTTDLKICTELVQYLGEFTTTLMLEEYQTVKIGFLGDPPYFNMKRANLKC